MSWLFKQNQLDKLFEDLRKQMFDLIDLIEIKIDISYILEELEEIEYKVKKLDKNNVGLSDEIREIRHKLFSQYKNNLADYLQEKKAKNLVKAIKNWLSRIANLY